MMGLSDLTIKEALKQMKEGSMLAEELCKKCNWRRKKTKSLNLYVTEIPDDEVLGRSRESQELIDKGKARSLEAIPIGFKNNFYIQGLPTTCGSRLLLNFKPSYSATLVTRCLENGAILDGMHNLDELAMGSSTLTSCHGPTKNPWTLTLKRSPTASDSEASLNKTLTSPLRSKSNDEDFYIPGGSSGGSAAAVAAGTCLAAFGSDTGGSVRLPAAYCGVVGLKPTYGLLSKHGLVPMMDALDHPGIFTKTVEDCAIVLNSVLGYDINDPVMKHSNPSQCRLDLNLQLSDIHIGIPKEYHLNSMSEEITTLWQDTADLLAKAGAKVSQVSLPHTIQSDECYHFLCCCEIATTFSRFYGKEFGGHKEMEQSTGEPFAEIDLQDFSEEVRKRLQAGMDFLRESNYEKRQAKAQKDKQDICMDFKRVFDSGVDLLLTPMASSDAPLKSWFLNEENCKIHAEIYMLTIPANLAGIPAISVPLGLSQRGLPLSLQLIGRPLEESQLLSVAHWLEQHAKFPRLSLDFLDEEEED